MELGRKESLSLTEDGAIFTAEDLNESGDFIAEEQVNGFNTKHYKWDVDAWRGRIEGDDLEIIGGSGDYYIADQGFVIKVNVEFTVRGLNDEDLETISTIIIESEIFDFNDHVIIVPPSR